MWQPLQDKVVVKLDDSLPNAIGLLIPMVTDKFRAKEGAIEGWNRGTVVRVGPGKRHPKTGVAQPVSVKPGDVIRFSELEYPEERIDGDRYVLIGETDIMGVEEEGSMPKATLAPIPLSEVYATKLPLTEDWISFLRGCS